ncbi:hypothetical protein DPMN_003932 [Dreissena polymorpha]|uniref:Uncharacterized protein n=1 Tax=Dreissena polymorpha TaxID=45954 RepID=A0A9D4RV66_DREPO|nr:hypothetical protein DPMN_003932 [Dreissena polymorpha]
MTDTNHLPVPLQGNFSQPQYVDERGEICPRGIVYPQVDGQLGQVLIFLQITCLSGL